ERPAATQEERDVVSHRALLGGESKMFVDLCLFARRTRRTGFGGKTVCALAVDLCQRRVRPPPSLAWAAQARGGCGSEQRAESPSSSTSLALSLEHWIIWDK
ncbi:hypothetical protein THAOC_23335, partial [Thalassiosira oceanica]